MSVKCVFDNPATRRREAYEDGEMIAFVTDEFLYLHANNERACREVPLLHWGKFVNDRVIGDKDAMKQKDSQK